MDTKSKHLMMDIWLKNELHSSHLDQIGAIVDAELSVIQKVQYSFEPIGDTWVWILSESHFSIHTYPEHRYLSLDVYICNEKIDLDAISQKILKVLPVKNYHKRCLRRGDLSKTQIGDLF